MVLMAGHEGWSTSSSILTAVLEASEDAIVSKALDGTILTWNHAAERLFGHSAHEVLGKSISILIPEDRRLEEQEILASIRQGQQYHKRDTVRRRGNGELIDLSVTVSPVRAKNGEVVGAAKIARDVTNLRVIERQALLVGELNHRIKNLFALATGLVSQSARECTSIAELELAVNGRLLALGRAHDASLPDLQDSAIKEVPATLLSLLGAILSPYGGTPVSRVSLGGTDIQVGRRTLTSLGLLYHELATNAVKHGCLSNPEGHLDVAVSLESTVVNIQWTERGSSTSPPEGSEGFGSRLERVCVTGMGATMSRDWQPEGLIVNLAVPIQRIRE